MGVSPMEAFGIYKELSFWEKNNEHYSSAKSENKEKYSVFIKNLVWILNTCLIHAYVDTAMVQVRCVLSLKCHPKNNVGTERPSVKYYRLSAK